MPSKGAIALWLLSFCLCLFSVVLNGNEKVKEWIKPVKSKKEQKIKKRKDRTVEAKKKGRPTISKAHEQFHAPTTKPRASFTRKKRKKLLQQEYSAKPKKKMLSTMKFAELKKSKEEHLAAGNNETAIKYLEKMIPQCVDMREREAIMIELADLYYETGRLIKAYAMYREFVNLYPGSQKVEYALYRAIVCKLDGIYDAERDQEPTKETIKLAQEFLDRAEVFTTYKDKVEEILKQCRERLFENEVAIFTFYLLSNRIIAANKRLDSIRKEFIPLMPEFEPKIILLEVDLAQAVNNDDLVNQKQDELITKFPNYVMQIAQTKPKKKHFASQF